MDEKYEIPHKVEPNTGDLIDQYKVQKKLGEGSFGSVYLVADKKNNKSALKLLKLYAVPYEEQRIKLLERFKLEYETGQIKSKYLVHSRSYGKIKGNPYIVMDFCPNGDLRNKITKLVTIDYANKVARSMLLGLKALHNEGKVHRDLKPENVLLDEDNNARLTDFGISGHKDMRMTKIRFGKPQEIFGTYAYMPPEQIKPANKHSTILPTTDIFSFGATMFEIITQNLPFGPLQEDSDLPEYVVRLNKGRWDNIKALRHDVPDYWIEIIETCLQPKYTNRYQNVDEILQKLGNPVHNRKVHYSSVRNDFGLKVMQGEEFGKVYNLSKMLLYDEDGLLTIGRKDEGVENEIEIVEDMTTYISRKHATIEKLLTPKGWFVRDGQFDRNTRSWKFSTNGTYVNSRQVGIDYFKLEPNDIITIGDTTLKVIII